MAKRQVKVTDVHGNPVEFGPHGRVVSPEINPVTGRPYPGWNYNVRNYRDLEEYPGGHWPGFKDEEGYFTPGIGKAPGARELVEDVVENTLQRTMNQKDFFTSGGMLGWRKKHQAIRSKFYDPIAERAFNPEALEQLGYMRQGRNFFELLGDVETSTPPIWEAASSGGKGRTRESDDWRKAVYEGEATGAAEEQLSVVQQNVRKKAVRGGKVSRSSVISSIMDWEMAGKVRFTPGSHGELFPSKRSSPEQFSKWKNRKGMWVIGESSRSVHFWDPQSQFEYGRWLFGQSRYLETAEGKKIFAGQKPIVGQYLEAAENSQMDVLQKRFKRMKEVDAFKEARRIYFRSQGELSHPSFSQRKAAIEKLLEDVAGKDALEANKRIQRKQIKIDAAKRLKEEFFGELVPNIKDVDVRGMAQREFLENLDIGTKVRLKGGVDATVRQAETTADIGVIMKGGKVMPLSSLIEKDMQRAEAIRKAEQGMFFRVNVRKETWYGAGGAFDPDAIRIELANGVGIGSIDAKKGYNKTLFKEIESGVVPGEWWARVYKYKAAKKAGGETLYGVALFGSGNERGAKSWWNVSPEFRLSGQKSLEIPEHILKKAGAESAQEFLEAIYLGKYKPGKMTKAISKGLMERFPTKVRSNIIDLAEKESKLSKKFIVGASIIAGAMLLYGATRKRETPITESDIPAGQYGAPNLQSSGAQGVYTPQARIIPNNTGYVTNIDVEARDGNGNVDYRGIVNAMSNMSSRALGTHTKSSLHIVDDSQRMDKESIRRSMNAQLR
jgi:hypothetical protein